MADKDDRNNDYIEDPTAMDGDVNDTIVTLNYDGVDREFELLSVEEYKDEQYVILCPVESFEGMSDDEVLIFRLIPAEDENSDDELEAIEDEELLQAVFNVFTENYYGGDAAFDCGGDCSACDADCADRDDGSDE